jgi:uncharacterized membrane protein YGL010W
MLQLLIGLIVLGAILYILTMLPIDATIKRIIQVIVIVFVIVWLLQFFWPMLGGLGTPRLR